MADRKRAPRSKDGGRDDRPLGLSIPSDRPKAGDECQDDQSSAGALTDTEERIFDALVAGKTRGEICRELGMGRTLYYYHLHAMRRYFRVETTTQAVLAYVRYKAAREGSPTPLAGQAWPA